MEWRSWELVTLVLYLAGAEGRGEVPYTETYTYIDTHFMFFSERLTWEEAVVVCPSYRSRLAVVDDMDKAVFLAQSMAFSNMIFDDMWIGGRKVKDTWVWEAKEDPILNSPEHGFPPWVRRKFRRDKNCLAMDRRSHDTPVFADLNCNLMRPFICEKSAGVDAGRPMPVKWLRVGDSMFILYHGQLKWREAASFCRHHGFRLAVVDSHKAAVLIGEAMITSRPDFERVWVGAHASRGSFSWMSTGVALSDVTNPSTLFPPWGERVDYVPGTCVLMDRNNCSHPLFLVENCDRKRDFVCEDYPKGLDNSAIKPMRFHHGSNIFSLYAVGKTWRGADKHCKQVGGQLVTLTDAGLLSAILDAMADHPSAAVKHVWVGGVIKDSKWVWSSTKEGIPQDKDGFLKWFGESSPERSCLNLDRCSYLDPMVYGLDCDIRQPYVCKTECTPLGFILHGHWSCKAGEEGNDQECQLQCKKSHAPTGSAKFTCTLKDGWVGGHGDTEFSRCKETTKENNSSVRRRRDLKTKDRMLHDIEPIQSLPPATITEESAEKAVEETLEKEREKVQEVQDDKSPTTSTKEEEDEKGNAERIEMTHSDQIQQTTLTTTKRKKYREGKPTTQFTRLRTKRDVGNPALFVTPLIR